MNLIIYVLGLTLESTSLLCCGLMDSWIWDSNPLTTHPQGEEWTSLSQGLSGGRNHIKLWLMGGSVLLGGFIMLQKIVACVYAWVYIYQQCLASLKNTSYPWLSLLLSVLLIHCSHWILNSYKTCVLKLGFANRWAYVALAASAY